MYKKRNKFGQFCITERATIICKICKKKFQVIDYRKNTAKFCSLKCSYIYHSGKNHHQYSKSPSIKTKNKIAKTLTGKCSGSKGSGWKGGIKMHTEGYILLHMPEHPYAKNRYITVHRYSVECVLGRFLNSKEVPHHINGIKDDNRPENLYLFVSCNEHNGYHANFRYGNVKQISKSNLFNC